MPIGRRRAWPRSEPAVDQAELRELERRLRAVAEPAMRREVALEALEAMAPEAAYALLAAGLIPAAEGGPLLPCLRDTLHAVLLEGGAARAFGYELRADLYAVAAERGDDFVMRLLQSPDCAESMRDPASALPRAVAEIPLGVRRALAKGLDLDLLERLLLDPDPVVIGNLLDNARITEDHVVRIAARRPIPGSTLARIQRSRRFGARPRVRLALARNPYCPTDIAIGLLAALDGGSLRQIAADGTLHPQVRRHARDELGRRRPEAG
jgi:hypothetical protein